MKKPLPCIVCGAQPEAAFRIEGGTYQPYCATMFDAGNGHYGSTVWDEMRTGVSLTINVCDPCLLLYRDRVAVVTTVRQEPEVIVAPWLPETD